MTHRRIDNMRDPIQSVSIVIDQWVNALILAVSKDQEIFAEYKNKSQVIAEILGWFRQTYEYILTDSPHMIWDNLVLSGGQHRKHAGRPRIFDKSGGCNAILALQQSLVDRMDADIHIYDRHIRSTLEVKPDMYNRRKLNRSLYIRTAITLWLYDRGLISSVGTTAFDDWHDRLQVQKNQHFVAS